MVVDQMKSLVIRNFFYYVGDPEYQNFNNLRFGAVANVYAEIIGIDPNSNTFKRNLKSFKITEEDLLKLQDEDLLSLYDVAIKRFFTQC